MAKRGGENAADAKASAPGKDLTASANVGQTQTFARIVILSTLLLLAIYTVVAVMRIQREPQTVTIANAVLPSRAEALAARVDGEAIALRGGLLAARESLARTPNAPIDAAEAGLRSSAGSALAVAVLSETELLAQTGKPEGVDWRAAVSGAPRGDRELWFDAVGQTRPVLTGVAVANTSAGRRWIVASAE